MQTPVQIDFQGMHGKPEIRASILNRLNANLLRHNRTGAILNARSINMRGVQSPNGAII